MDTNKLIQQISKPDADIDKFAQMAINDRQIRDEIVHQMLTHPHIMVYYHCYYVVSKASQERPDLFFAYWDSIVPLLKHKNSYHRDFSLTILANLTQADSEDRFLGIFDDYFDHLNDKKFMTAVICVQSSQKIIHHKPVLRDRIIALLLDIDQRCTYPEKQQALMKCDILEVIDDVYQEMCDKTRLEAFINTQLNSPSPKTKKKAQEMGLKYGLNEPLE